MAYDHYPPEYEKGKITFFGKDFIVTPDVLIPRLETEGLVRRAREIIRENHIERIIDIGAGSGIIGVSCADLAPKTVFADISPGALEIAEKNFRKHFPQGEAIFVESDLFSHIPREAEVKTLVLSNLPYIRAEDWDNMSPDTRHEPRLALFGGEKTGFELYERFFQELWEYQGKNNAIACLIEFGYDQRELAEQIIGTYPWKHHFFADYAGIERFCEIRLTNI